MALSVIFLRNSSHSTLHIQPHSPTCGLPHALRDPLSPAALASSSCSASPTPPAPAPEAPRPATARLPSPDARPARSPSWRKRASLGIVGHLFKPSHSRHSLFVPGQPPPSPAAPPSLPVEEAVCPCCAARFGIPDRVDCLSCPTCAVVWDLPAPRASGGGGSRNSSVVPPPPADASFRISQGQVARLRALALSPDHLALFNADPAGFLASKTAASLQAQVASFHELAATLVSGLFSSVVTLSNAFLSPSTSSPRDRPHLLDIHLARSFFQAVCTGPGGSDLLASHLNRFLGRPGSQVWTIITNGRAKQNESRVVVPTSWAWVAVLFECPLLSSDSLLDQKTRLIITARLLSFLSSLSNRLHHELVSLYTHHSYTPTDLLSKVQIVNVFISSRIGYFLQIPAGFGGSMAENALPGYMLDWPLLSASRVMSLLFGINHRTRKLPITSFYNVSTDLVDPLDLLFDFEIWETRRSGYCLSGYPCLLTITTKISLLAYEEKRQMGVEARQAFIQGILGHCVVPPVFQLNIRRSHLVEDSLRQIEAGRSELKKLLKIGFVGEEGLDGGGLKKEWFLLLIRKLVAPEYGMFVHDENTHQIWFNPASMELGEYKLIGTVVGLAIYNRATLDLNLPLACYKKLLNHPVGGLEDLASFRPSLARGLQWILDYDGDDFAEVCGRNMVGDYEAYGTVVEEPLVAGGSDIPVTKANKSEYVRLYTNFILNESVEKQFSAFARGFHVIAAGNALSLFQPEEIELLVRGSDEPLDVEQLKAGTIYEGYCPEDLTVQFFWNYVRGLDAKEQKKLLRFITGTDRIPATGSSGLCLKITKAEDLNRHYQMLGKNNGKGLKGRLPISHTCFNQIDLPDFKDQRVLNEKMKTAINESEGFGLN